MKHLLSIVAATAILAMTSVATNAGMASDTAATGTFTGDNDHVTTGGVSIVKTANGGAVVILDTDFSLDNAPDAHVGFGKDGTYVEATDLGDLVQKEGLQVYIVPASVNVDDFNEVYIWCKQVGVSLGMAPLN